MPFPYRDAQRAEPFVLSAAAPASEDRVGRLRERFLRGQREICIERARYLTESYRQTEGVPAVLNPPVERRLRNTGQLRVGLCGQVEDQGHPHHDRQPEPDVRAANGTEAAIQVSALPGDMPVQSSAPTPARRTGPEHARRPPPPTENEGRHPRAAATQLPQKRRHLPD